MTTDESIMLASAPINEVGFSIATAGSVVDPFHIGGLHQRFAGRYPQVERQFPVAALELGALLNAPPLIFDQDRGVGSRWWFVSEDEATLVQAQERLIAWNWRRRGDFAGPSPYIGYEKCVELATDAFSLFRIALGEQEAHVPDIAGCELLYDNIILLPQDQGQTVPLDKFLKMWKSGGQPVVGLQMTWLESMNGDVRIDLGEVVQVMIAQVMVARPNSEIPAPAIKIQFRAFSNSVTWDNYVGFFDRAHDFIGRRFRMLISDELYERLA